MRKGTWQQVKVTETEGTEKGNIYTNFAMRESRQKRKEWTSTEERILEGREDRLVRDTPRGKGAKGLYWEDSQRGKR